MALLTLILMIAAFLLLVGAAVGIPTGRVSLGWLGMALWALVVLLGGAHL